jgi:hypothetical protein
MHKKKKDLLKMHHEDCEHGVKEVVKLTRSRHWGALSFVIIAAVLTATSCIELLDNKTWQFIPTFCIVFLGLALTNYAYHHLCMRAAARLQEMYKNWDRFENSTSFSAKKSLETAIKRQAEKERQYAMATSTFSKKRTQVQTDVSHFEPDHSIAKDWNKVGIDWKHYGEAAERELAAKIEAEEAKHYADKMSKEYEHVWEHEHFSGHYHSMPEIIARIIHHEDIIAKRIEYDDEEEHKQQGHKDDWYKWETYMKTMDKFNPFFNPWSNIFYGCSSKKRDVPLSSNDGMHDEFGGGLHGGAAGGHH